MIFGFDLLAYVTGGLLLAASSVQCTVPEAPRITIIPTTEDVQYDYSRSAEELGRKETNTISPYGVNIDQISGGLREDEPKIEMKMMFGVSEYPALDVGCMWYASVDIKIILSPKIYVAREFARDYACKVAVLKHERRHVDVDHQVINKYAEGLGLAVENAVNSVGAVGPFRVAQVESIQNVLKKHIKDAVDSQMLVLNKEMTRLQQEVDSLEEYQKISKTCRKVMHK